MLTIVHNQVNPASGLTIKQENLRQTHAIPLNTLVEVDCSYIEEHGLRLFVVAHERDCDGSPLYGLSFKKKKDIDSLREIGINEFVLKLMVTGGFSDDCLVIVE